PPPVPQAEAEEVPGGRPQPLPAERESVAAEERAPDRLDVAVPGPPGRAERLVARVPHRASSRRGQGVELVERHDSRPLRSRCGPGSRSGEPTPAGKGAS